MCGRYTLFTPQPELEERFEVTAERPLKARYNCAPGQQLPIIRNDAPDTLRFVQWGFIPEWAESRSKSFINARAESVAEKRSFRDAFERRRCLVPADGFYEWTPRENGDGKQPYRVAFEDDRPFAMAGIWERWTPPEAQTGLDEFTDDGAGDPEPIETFAIITTEPNGVVSPLHDRMAVVLSLEEEEKWLSADADTASTLLDPYPEAEMRAYPVSTRVNSPANDSPTLVEEVNPA
ncbi:SOS response-associated peptidase [Haloprofundus sp. MHR1]|uniref:SOS response-associated peptidase n=1 Tax=Haloprofundus sp. MHR1 TaxID=2572921 RepID=UPI0010BE5B35|nr:SOS response-associated peptidase [Haloprofundus sp. MHR1]QCJ48361.1 SOS response-associated peptidase [Haloprofundus sp. MHR1]